MAISTGTRLGPYEIVAPIGAGGMGEVFRARDTRLGRDVAIKVSKEKFSDRFEREARAVAAVNHPHISALYDVGPDYLVMEYIAGTPLKGPLPLTTVLEYSAQILDALDAAHSKGIAHRDLKPGNILVTKQGIKLLDFGLAKHTAPLADTDATEAVTHEGVIAGTPQYMSPEQLQGKHGDARSDIFSFGLVLYEMLTGKRAFEGSSKASVIGAILERRAPSIAGVAPEALDRILQRCLAKDPDDRWQSARDLRAALELTSVPQATVHPVRSRPLPWSIAAGIFAIAAAAALWALWREPVPQDRPLYVQVAPPTGAAFVKTGGSAISPDGRLIAFVAVSTGGPKLWFRSLDSLTARELPGTDGAQFPFWSPDDKSIGFFAGGKLKRIDLSGGPPAVLADAPAGRGASWGTQGAIIFSPALTSGLERVSATGGAPVVLTTLDSAAQELGHRWPQFLPDGHTYVYFVQSRDATRSGLYLGSLERPQARTHLVETLAGGGYAPPRGKRPGYLLWVRQNTITAQAFDPAAAKLSGDAFPVPGAEALGPVAVSYFESISVAANVGTILSGATTSDRFQPSWFNREGKAISAVGRLDDYGSLRIAPDGTRIGLSVQSSSGDRDIWTIDIARGVQTRITGGHDLFLQPVWTPNSARIAFAAANATSIYSKNANGSGDQETDVQASNIVYPDDFSPDGRYFIYEESKPDNHTDLWVVPTTGDRKPVPYLKTSAVVWNAQFSPDGKWVAYTSDESGQPEIYVQSFPASDVRTQVSNGGGNFPRWRRDGKELFYRAPDGRLMVASVHALPKGLEFGIPEGLFHIMETSGPHAYPYDITADGQRILSLTRPGSEGAAPLTLLINWQAAVKQ